MRTIGVEKPRISPLRLEGLPEADDAPIRAHGDYDGRHFGPRDVSGDDLAGVSFLECALDGWTAHDTRLRDASFAQTRIENLNAPVLRADRASLRNVEIHRSRFGSADLSDTRLEQLVVSASKLGWVNFRSARLRDVVFRDCTFDELDLTGADVSRMAFEDCTAGKLTLARSSVRHLDLRGLRFDGLDGPEGLRGAVLSSPQLAAMAGMFAEHFGIRVDD
ncbi:MAG: pentapeptide repeat-containing protein [Microbacterium sp.]|uniref:pentapeptide repeat-containing protein n=1 Tax=Microbacterium sp. TaxID=51671 RepID=UPI0026195CCA|nr:pentapeptide repeat-containing protein [Microbacterium sp.]MCX6501442.1 pentapeptide repeat-containing protein [Microbacterium sp.]